ncbi:hypothetical protein [Chryseobacterium koreense]|uniref:GTP-binding protein n=1 Tax=Chryseobacterium koreense CCUG 49689 TaxID=1304281 RepID=A0A0J7IWU0_9FLAO|nr:hypothetical protein [Chryseobacterium koreense]KMQ70274.1 hypothetical protein ACM44_13160 [Chryseobacterium koreense CCUG 49689]MBB5332581.1 flagellar biogenesis protein FliO [Chryseobacterium koreense]
MKIEQTVLDQIRSRPVFKISGPFSREEYAQGLREFLAEHSDEFSGNINSEVAIIKVKTAHNDYWKPNLALRTESDGIENSTIVRGVFGPSSAVWTFFMFLYFMFGILWMVFITIWYVEKQIKSTDFPWAFSMSFLMLFGILLTYLLSIFGQSKAKSEMKKLRQFAEDSILKVNEIADQP